ncbi:MAG: EAL domain-containing protein [Gammaproteobacteria bacterium]|nr:EAL domain-containing protein [Gammaproteobacteria bacterium]
MADAQMESRFTPWLLGLFLLSLLILLGLARFVWLQGQGIQDRVQRLAAEDLAQLVQINRLRSSFMEQSLALQRLYATADAEDFGRNQQARRERLHQHLRDWRQLCPSCGELDRLAQLQGRIEQHGTALFDIMRSKPIDWDASRTELYAADDLAMQADALLTQWVDGIGASTERSRQQLHSGTRELVFSVLAAVLAILLLASFVAYFSWRLLVEARLRRRLALFPERNPLPVYSLAADARLLYANPAAEHMRQQLVPEAADAGALLPAELAAQLPALLREQGQAEWEYELAGASLQAGIHCLKDLGVCHAYVRDISAQRQAERQLSHQALHDAVTDLANRRAFEDELEQMLDQGRSGAILLLHLNRFHSIIKSLGHAMGDQVLRASAERLSQALTAAADDSRLFRFEGELFAVLLTTPDSLDASQALSRQLQQSMLQPLDLAGRELVFTLSLGASHFPRDGKDADRLMRRAHSALQQLLQANGEGLLHFSPEMDQRALEWLELEQDLRQAQPRDELELFYQPQLDLASGWLTGVEALVRWRHPQRGLVSPADFIPLAEETGLILPMGEWILRRACTQAMAWREAGLPPLVMAVNLSARQFQDPGLPELVQQILRETGLPAEWLELEITESAAMQDLDQAIQGLQALQAIGLQLAIDDFGTGYSSLAYLSRFPLDKLKIDQSFVRQMTTEASDLTIVRALVALARGLNLRLIAEGVETSEQEQLLQELGCDQVQGYKYSRPLPSAELEAFLRGLTNPA